MPNQWDDKREALNAAAKALVGNCPHGTAPMIFAMTGECKDCVISELRADLAAAEADLHNARTTAFRRGLGAAARLVDACGLRCKQCAAAIRALPDCALDAEEVGE